MPFLMYFSGLTAQQYLLSSKRKKTIVSYLPIYFASKSRLSPSHTYSYSSELQSLNSVLRQELYQTSYELHGQLSWVWPGQG